jgi:hypothetical protein
MIHSELESVDHEDAFLFPAVSNWRARFLEGTTELSDNPRSGRPHNSDLAEKIRQC